MRRWLAALLAAAALSLLTPALASAHPLGNFTINHFTRLEIAGSRLSVIYVVDFAEIPTFQEQQAIAADPRYLDYKVAQLERGMDLRVDGTPVALKLLDRAISFKPGQAGLPIMRLQFLLAASMPAGAHSAVYHDWNYGDRLGWREVVAVASEGAQLSNSTVPTSSISNELRSYPQDMLLSPLNVTSASFDFVPGAGMGGGVTLLRGGAGAFGFVQDRFASLIAAKHLSAWLLAFSLLAAVGLGALHALSPGHGKAMMAGYLVGTRGTPRHAVALGLVITATHTSGVFALGLVTLYAASFVTPDRLYPYLTLISGLLILVIGARLLWSRLRAAAHGHEHGHEHVHHDGDHDGHGHAHPNFGVGGASLIALGVSGGLVPCPSALVVLLAAVSLHRVLFGLLLIVGFSLGLAAVLTGIGIALAWGAPLLKRVRDSRLLGPAGRATLLVPVASALVVTLTGLVLTAQAIPGVI